MSYLGLDIGTSGCKAVVFNKDGREIASAYQEYALLSPRPGWAELNSSHVCDACFQVICKTAGACADDPVRALSISSQGEAFTPVGADGELLGNGMVSSDTRATALSESWSEEFGREKLYKITGHTAHPLFSLFKLLWLRQEEPDLWKRARYFYCYEDLMHHRLGVQPAISWPLAGRTMLFNVFNRDWSAEILGAIGLKKEKLARPLPSGTIVGSIPKDIAAQINLRDNVKVVTGGHDQTCAALGAGAIKDGTGMYATGTVECICPAFSKPRTSSDLFENNLCCYNFTIQDMYTTVAYSLTGGNLLKWFRDEWAQKEVENAQKSGLNPYEVILNILPREPTELMVLPYFTPTGTPYFDTDAKGAILGLSLNTSRAEVLKALLEGVAYEMRLNLDIMEKSKMVVNELIATGGGARSAIWTQLKADVLNKPIKTIEIEEAGCFGAAMLACTADTSEPLKNLVVRNSSSRVLIKPDVKNADYYTKRFNQYRQLYPTLKKFWKK